MRFNLLAFRRGWHRAIAFPSGVKDSFLDALAGRPVYQAVDAVSAGSPIGYSTLKSRCAMRYKSFFHTGHSCAPVF